MESWNASRELKVVFVEPGVAWVAWWLDAVDDMSKRQGYKFPAITELPSHYFHRNIFLTFIDESLGLHRMRDVIGVENIMWSTDSPHPVTSWPNSRKIVEEQFTGIPADERALMLSGNAIPGLEPVTLTCNAQEPPVPSSCSINMLSARASILRSARYSRRGPGV